MTEQLAPCRVLVIDDLADAASTLALQLKHAGCESTYVTDPRQAVVIAEKFKPDAVLLDIGMPHINGYQLAPMLRRALEPRSIRVVAVTAWGSVKDREMSRACGFDAHLVKPVVMDTMLSTLGTLLNRDLR